MKQVSKNKYGILAVVLFALVLFPVGDVFAQRVPGASESGPGGGVLGIMERHARVQRIIARAATAAILPPSSSLAASCFERSLSHQSRLGAFFSDMPPRMFCNGGAGASPFCAANAGTAEYLFSVMPPTTEEVFGGSYYDGEGSTPFYNPLAGLAMKEVPDIGPTPNTMAHHLAGAVGSILFSTLSGSPGDMADYLPGIAVVDSIETTPYYADGLSNSLGLSYVNPPVIDPITNVADSGSLMGYIHNLGLVLGGNIIPLATSVLSLSNPVSLTSQLSGDIEDMNEDLRSAQQGEDLTAMMNEDFPAFLAGVQATWNNKAAVYDGINDDGGIAQLVYAQVFAPGAGYVWSEDTSMDGCNAFAQMWGGDGITVDQFGESRLPIAGVEGQGVDLGIPFATYEDIISLELENSSGAYERLLAGAGNDTQLAEALNDSQTLLEVPTGILNPNGLESWRAAPPTITLPQIYAPLSSLTETMQ